MQGRLPQGPRRALQRHSLPLSAWTAKSESTNAEGPGLLASTRRSALPPSVPTGVQQGRPVRVTALARVCAGGPSTSEGRCRLGCGPCRPAAGCRQVNRFRLTRPLEATCRGACIGHMGRQGRSGTTRCTILGRHLRPRLGRDAATGLFSRAAVPARLEHDRAAAARSRGGFSDAERRLHYQFRTRTTASRRPCSSLRRRPIR